MKTYQQRPLTNKVIYSQSQKSPSNKLKFYILRSYNYNHRKMAKILAKIDHKKTRTMSLYHSIGTHKPLIKT